ncbi:hypothetical protein CHLRE_01g022600v5 [Chlamydomonas reinhardtii]|uniref:Sulfotransferase n=1 Tax=Chlamydomonas reinhardtii TaxID=3055 RepID=A0A2K3E667_CHLRE|nr:uncharacterized protein CHLRE_01g022600v5 [Chlamydomonas reinhardtii]PNW88282.1 hypothetical protein CHLRE_01g022600v5 [Chlamydomonas reinhardtii]
MSKVGFWLTAALAAACAAMVRGATDECQALTDHYLEKHHKEAEPYTGSNMLYFLHVPRTAGRTFHSCLLKIGTHPARRCPKAYDHLRLTNMTAPACYLLSSHDDFSVVSMLPPDVAVINQLRDPLDRFLSAYEFAIEVAARSLKRPKNFRKKVGRIATEDVWPWSYLIPFFAEDMRPKVAAAQAVPQPEGGRWIEVEQDGERWFHNKALNVSRWNLTDEEAGLNGGVLPLLDPYDNELVMSLREFAQHPIATELLHNGAAFQVLGITNYSHWGDAGTFRACLSAHPPLSAQLLEVAKSRVRRFTHVGTTDRLFDSAASALVSMGLSIHSPAYSGGDDDVAGRGGTRRRAAAADEEDDGSRHDDAGGRGGRGAGGGRGLAAQLQLMAKLVREARTRLQAAQRDLVNAQRDHSSDEAALEALRGRVDKAREDLIAAQDRLAETRDRLPTGEAEAGLGLGGGGGGGGGTEDVARRRGQRRLLEAEADGGVAEAVEGAAEELQADGSGREVLSTGSSANKVVVPQVDGFGNPLDMSFKRIPNSDVGTEFVRCAARAQQRSASRRDQSLAALSTSDGRHVAFSKAARKRIPQEVLDLIRSHNAMDTELHSLGLALLDARIAEQKAAGLFHDLPKLPPTSDRGAAAKRGSGPRLVKPLSERGGSEGELRR